MKLKKIKRYFLVFVSAFIVLSSCVTASASDLDVSDVKNNFGGFKVKYLTVVCRDLNGNLVKIENVDVTASSDAVGENDPSRGIVLNVTCERALTGSNCYQIAVGLLMANDKYTDPDLQISGSFLMGFSNTFFDVYQNESKQGDYGCFRYNVTYNEDGFEASRNYVQKGTLTFPNTDYTEYVKSTFPKSDVGDSYNLYVTNIFGRPYESRSTFSIALYNFNFTAFDPVTGKLTEIENTITESTDAIIENNNENTEAIINNENKNMDELMNGWTDNTSLDESVTDAYDASQQELIDNTVDGRNAAVSAFSNIGNTFIFRCLHSTTSIFSEYLKIDWLYSLIEFSLALGMFSFLIGAVCMVIGKLSSDQKAEDRKNNPRVYTYNHYHYLGKKSDSNK